jgi:hypothetical protein
MSKSSKGGDGPGEGRWTAVLSGSMVAWVLIEWINSRVSRREKRGMGLGLDLD